ncbi:AIPR family protein [Mesorhizobium sp. M0674]|uniref:AIPR family protein n=1 Tax=unclassified Mesorhizobium TaxID=325217 RepID=UPI00333E0AEB
MAQGRCGREPPPSAGLDDGGDIEEIAPRISQSANNQNRVDMADFSSIHPFHGRMQELSGDLGAPGGRYATSVTLVLRTCAR